jgi:glycosyltransferase involved in cell wall biosynthesis
MKIAQVCPDYYPYIGGAQKYVKEVSERLVRKGFSIDVLTTDRTGTLPAEEEINGVKVRRFKSWEGLGSGITPGAYYFSRDLRRYLSRNSGSYDVVHAHIYAGLPALYAARAKAANRFVLNPYRHRGTQSLFAKLLHIPWRLVARDIYQKADRILCVSDYERSLVLTDFGVEARKISLVPLGVNLDEFRSMTKKEKSQTVLYVGRLERYKGVEFLIRALPKLDTNIRLEIDGKGPDRDRLVRLAKVLHVEDRVKYDTSTRAELLRKYAEAGVFVLLSKYETFSLSVADALASRTPCIVANSSALRDWIDYRNCFGIEYPIDIDELAHLIKSVIGRCAEGVKLRDWNDVVEQLIKLYEGLAGEPRNSSGDQLEAKAKVGD